MTNQEAVARIKDHKTIHKMDEPRAIYISEALDMAIKALENQNTGHWFIKEGGNVCSNCGNTQFKYTSLDFDWRPHYCPNCGADMRGEIE